MNKFCSHCGREYDITANFCPSCGHKNEMAPAVQPVPVQPVQKKVIEVQPQAVQATPIQVQAAQAQASPVPVQVSQTQATPVQMQPQTVQAGPTQVQPQTVQTAPAQVQPQATQQPQAQIAQPQAVQAVPTQVQPQAVQQPQTQIAQPQPTMYGSNQTYIDASMYANAPAKPKKNHTWIIVVSVVGGLFLLLIVLFAIFITLMLTSGTGTNTLFGNNSNSNRSLQELRDYYYADYEDADLNSSEFLNLNTEDSSGSDPASTEAPSNASTESSSTVSIQSADFQDHDLTLINVTNQEVLDLSSDTAYFLQVNAPDRQTSLSQSTVSQYTDAIPGDTDYSLGRGIAPGASLADFCNAYGINSSNSMLQVYNNDAWNYYYFSNPGTLSGLSADTICLTIGWSKKGDAWTRLKVNSLQDYFSSAQASSDDEILFYTATLNIPTDSDVISADNITLQTIQIEYGTPDAFCHFYGLNTSEN